ncbi:MAG: hypothetical protein IIA82_02700 [Thaumarchaeota archaeon]|nr:hypothetical protein [Nitrososphaerota archaeon]
MSHTTLQKVLNDLLDKKFISKDKSYGITDKGKKLIKKLEELREILK